MAELAAAPIVIAGVQGVLALSRILRLKQPSARVDKWTKRVTTALELVEKHEETIQPDVMDEFLHRHDVLEENTNRLKEQMDNGSISAIEAWKSGKQIATLSRKLERFAITTSKQAIRNKLFCDRRHQHIPKNSKGRCLSCFPDSSDSEDSDGTMFRSSSSSRTTLVSLYSNSLETVNPWTSLASFNHRLEETSSKGFLTTISESGTC